MSEEGKPLSIKFQVAQVDKPLLAVSKLTSAGYRVWFDEHGCEVVHKKSDRITKFVRHNDVYVLKVWVRKGKESSSVNTRQ